MALRSTLMEDIQNYRREWLWHLLKEQFGGNKEAMSRAIHVSSGGLHNYLTKRLNPGERIARRVEEKLNLPAGSLDKPVEWQDRNGDRRQSPGPKPKRQRVAA